MSLETKNVDDKVYYVWIDILRGVAIMSVVLCHATEAVYLFKLEFISQLSQQSKVYAFFCEFLGRIGVPLFCFISGYLLLNRVYDEKQTIHFWKNNLFRLLIVVEFWIILYSFFLCFFNRESFSIFNVIKRMLFLQEIGLSHTWYLRMILGMYLFVPFVAGILQRFTINVVKIPLMIVFFYLFVIPVINVIGQGLGAEWIGSILDLSWSGQEYGTLFIIGGLMKKRPLAHIRMKWLLFIQFLSGVFIVFLSLWGWDAGCEYILWYNCAPLILCALIIFELVSRIKKPLLANVWRSLAQCSFGIYLVHNIVKEYVLLVVGKLNMILPVKVMIVFLATFLFSWGIVWILSKRFKFARILFYISKK